MLQKITVSFFILTAMVSGAADAVLKAKGFTDKNWTTRFFPGKDHSERSWAERLEVPLVFLLKK